MHWLSTLHSRDQILSQQDSLLFRKPETTSGLLPNNNDRHPTSNLSKRCPRGRKLTSITNQDLEEGIDNTSDVMKKKTTTDQHWSKLGNTLFHLLEFSQQDQSTSTTKTNSMFRSLLAGTTVTTAERREDTKTTSPTT